MSMLSSKFTWLWIGWLCGFLVIEIIALRDDESGGTLSEHAWYIVSSPMGAILLAIGFAILLYHFFKKANWR